MILKSHPDKTLKVHVGEVREAAQKVWFGHSARLHQQSAALFNWLNWAVTMHDVGKGCNAFQSYIRDCKGFKGNPALKAHTPMSFVVSLTHGNQLGWDWRQTLAVMASAAGHHSRFKTIDELQRPIANTQSQFQLVDQLVGFDWNAVSEAVSDVTTGDVGLQPGFEDDDDLADLSETFTADFVEETLYQLPSNEAIRFRLQCQFVYSVLLEADKAYLIIAEAERDIYRRSARRRIPPSVVTDFIAANKKRSKLDALRTDVRKRLSVGMRKSGANQLQTMTLPTGSGKTLLAATWAIEQRAELQTESHTPPTIVVLPFLSIIEQTQKDYRDLLGDQCGLLSYHSLSDRDHEDTEEPNAASFLLDTWHGDVIITTFDQFLLALLDSRSRHQMRFHQLCDALIIMDEVQALPFILWDLVSESLSELVTIGNCRLLAMSATQTGFLPEAQELIEHPAAVFNSLNRYVFVLKHDQPIQLDDFIDQIVLRAAQWKKQRVLIVLNTRRSARQLRDQLSTHGFNVEFISADVTPRDRLAAIERIRQELPCLVVSTQCIEAGVDIDMSLVIRDMGPFDSLVQVAGRCNRHADRDCETVEIVNLFDKKGKSIAAYVYDETLLRETRRVLNDYSQRNATDRLPESDIFALTQDYFGKLRNEKNCGETHTKQFARWEEMPPIQELLRGTQSNQVSFVVIEQDPALEQDLEAVKSVTRRWECRRLLRQLSARIARISVSVYAFGEFRPEAFARQDATKNLWLLQPGYYQTERGIDFSSSSVLSSHDSWGTIL